jgi:hypothetical protein
LSRLLVHPVLAVGSFAAVWLLFLAVLHPWLMNWGSTPDEQAMTLPGDTAPPARYLTRAITIAAPPSVVWPWLVAIGQDRAGFLSNDYLENLAGADIHNADALRPDWQQRAVGDKIPMSGEAERAVAGDVTLLTVRVLEPAQIIGDIPGRFVLQPFGAASTRLLLRESVDIPERAGFGWLIWDPMHFVMEQRMLQGIRERAEGQPFVPPVLQAAAHVGWGLAAMSVLALYLLRRSWRAWLIVPVGLVLPSLWLTGDLNSAIAGFLAIGVTLGGFLVFGRRWFAPYLLIATLVALVLLLAPDTYAAFGLIFIAVLAGAAVAEAGAHLLGHSTATSATRGRLGCQVHVW